jgi:hypothetical protein
MDLNSMGSFSRKEVITGRELFLQKRNEGGVIEKKYVP